MRVTRVLTASVTSIALAFSMLASTIPANAAITGPGFHAAWVAQSAYANGAPGQVIQMSAVYQNTGDSPWVKGQLGTSQANFATAAPRGNTTLSDAGWSAGQNWLAPNRYAAQANDLVATSQLGSFVWSVKVPATQAAGVVAVYGIPVIDGQTFMEDYGFFLNVTVGLGTVLISTTSPASPAANPQPIITGTGGGNACTVSILDGSTAVATTTSDASGNFQAATSPLAAGSHTLSASATCADGSFLASGNTKTYVYDKTAPTVTSVAAASPSVITVTFSEPVNQTGITGSSALNPANYVFTSGAAIAAAPAPAIDSTGTIVTLYLTAARPNPSGDTLTVSAVADLAGNVMTAQAVPYLVNDTTAPTITSATSAGPSGGGNATTVKVNWSEPVGCTGVTTVYSVDGVTEVFASGGGVTPTPTKCIFTLSPSLAPGTTHTLTVTNEKDLGGNTQSPNPATASFTVTTASTLGNMTVTGVTNPSGNLVRITFNNAVQTTPTSTWTVKTTPAGTTTAATAVLAVSAANGDANSVDIALTSNPFVAATECLDTATTCTLQINNVATETGANGELMLPAVQSALFTMTRDTVKPTGVSVTQFGTTQNTFDIKWSENVSAPNACVPATCTVKILSGTTVVASTTTSETATSLTLNLGDNVAGDTKTRITLTANAIAYATGAAATTALSYGTYTLTATAGVVNDLWFTPNASAAITSLPLAVVDTTAPTVAGAAAPANCGATQACKTFIFTWNDKVAVSGAGNALDLTHYTLNGAAVTGTLQVDTTGKIVTLDMLTSAPCTAGTSPCNESFAITGVTDLAGNVSSPNPSIFNFVRTF